MKNYLNKENFIKGYFVKLDEIYITYSDSKVVVIPYTDANINKVISIMENQVKNVDGAKLKNSFTKKSGETLLAFGISFAGFIFIPNMIFFIPLIIGGVSVLVGSIIITRQRKIEKDYQKNKYFLDNKESIVKCDEIKNSRIITLYDVPFNINDVDNYKLKELKEMKDFISKLEMLDPDDKSKAKQYIKK